VSLDRLNRTVARIVRGLFSHVYQRRLPTEYLADALALDGVHPVTRPMAQQILGMVGEEVPKRIGMVFSFRTRSFPEDPNGTDWLLDFYGSTCFIGITIPRASGSWSSPSAFWSAIMSAHGPDQPVLGAWSPARTNAVFSLTPVPRYLSVLWRTGAGLHR
jgi:hypothetical protein